MSFRSDFAWGAATASYQIEGACDADGKGLSVWDQFSRWPGKVRFGETGDRACDHYHRMNEDVALMADLGLKAYRFSLSWPRLFPEGTGRSNEAGFDFYDRLIDALLARGIAPWITLFHWDYPLSLYHRGGWLNSESPLWFADYATACFERFGDRAKHWITLNEPQMFVGLGHQRGIHAPGLLLPPADLTRISHHVLLAHGKAIQAMRAKATPEHLMGWAPAVPVYTVAPAFVSDPEVVDAARQHHFDWGGVENFAFSAATWTDPTLRGTYPETYIQALGHALPKGWEDDLAAIAQPLDFFGMNIYSASETHARDGNGQLMIRKASDFGPGHARTLIDWPVTPEAVYWGPRFFHERYGLPIVITENGLSCHDWVDGDGNANDPQRVDFMRQYLRQLKRAAEEGVDIAGYFHWSLMDNFEWSEGYRHRFGLIHVDYETLMRTPKASSRWYRNVIETNGASL